MWCRRATCSWSSTDRHSADVGACLPAEEAPSPRIRWQTDRGGSPRFRSRRLGWARGELRAVCRSGGSGRCEVGRIRRATDVGRPSRRPSLPYLGRWDLHRARKPCGGRARRGCSTGEVAGHPPRWDRRQPGREDVLGGLPAPHRRDHGGPARAPRVRACPAAPPPRVFLRRLGGPASVRAGAECAPGLPDLGQLSPPEGHPGRRPPRGPRRRCPLDLLRPERRGPAPVFVAPSAAVDVTHRAGLEVMAWCPKPDAARELLTAGVDGVVVDEVATTLPTLADVAD